MTSPNNAMHKVIPKLPSDTHTDPWLGNMHALPYVANVVTWVGPKVDLWLSLGRHTHPGCRHYMSNIGHKRTADLEHFVPNIRFYLVSGDNPKWTKSAIFWELKHVRNVNSLLVTVACLWELRRAVGRGQMKMKVKLSGKRTKYFRLPALL